jgi:hypothetical protein
VSELTLQVHSRVVLIVTFPEPPPEENELGDVVAVIAHFVALGAVAVTDVDEEVQPLTNKLTNPTTAARNLTARFPRQMLCQEMGLGNDGNPPIVASCRLSSMRGPHQRRTRRRAAASALTRCNDAA